MHVTTPVISSWRDLLKEVISDSAEKERIAREMNINPVTLVRWAQGISLAPRPHKLHQLVAAFPARHRALLKDLLRSEENHIQESETVRERDQIDALFLRHFWATRVTTPQPLQFWALSGKVLQDALRQLSPQKDGLALTIAQVMPPNADGVVRSLREVTGLGSPPWPHDLEHHMQFLGAESLVGYVASHCRAMFLDDLREQTTFLPVSQTEYEISAMASPILYANRIAGCLLCSSNQPGYFRVESRRVLIGDYAQLLASAFIPEQFVAPEQLALHLMPPWPLQQATLATFQKRFLALKMARQPSHLSVQQAECLAWQQIEEELLHTFSQLNMSKYARHE